MRTLVHLTFDTACAVLYVASIAVAVGAGATIITHRLMDGLLVGLAALVFAGGGFGYSLWRSYRPAERRLFRSKRVG